MKKKFSLIISFVLTIMVIMAIAITYVYLSAKKNNSNISDTKTPLIISGNEYKQLQQLVKKFTNLIKQIKTKKPNLYTYYNQSLQKLKMQFNQIDPNNLSKIKNLFRQYQPIVDECEYQLKNDISGVNPEKLINSNIYMYTKYFTKSLFLIAFIFAFIRNKKIFEIEELKNTNIFANCISKNNKKILFSKISNIKNIFHYLTYTLYISDLIIFLLTNNIFLNIISTVINIAFPFVMTCLFSRFIINAQQSSLSRSINNILLK